jgi:hypothetical protein
MLKFDRDSTELPFVSNSMFDLSNEKRSRRRPMTVLKIPRPL